MKKNILWGALMLMSMFGLTLTSCSDDDDNNGKGNITIKLEEVGAHNSKEVIVGKDLHVEASAFAENLIKAIKIELKDAGGKVVLTKDYSQTGKYTNVKNAHFHEHIDIPSTLTAGTYTFVFSVTDGGNQVGSSEVKLNVKAVDPDAPKITNLMLGDNTNTAKAGAKIKVKATVEVKSPVKEIELEFHGAEEYPINITGYTGKTGTFNVEHEITIPANAKEGTYHVHFTVEDGKDRETTAEIEGFKITK